MKALHIVLLVVVALVMGYVQERVKIDLNLRLAYAPLIEGYDALDALARRGALDRLVPQVPFDYYYSHGRIVWFDQLSTPQLARMKWCCALLFVAVFWWWNQLFLKAVNIAPRMRRFVTIGYLYMLGAALLLYTAVSLWDAAAPAYAVARRLLGLLQSPLPGVVLYLALRFPSSKHIDHGTAQSPS